MAKNGGRYHIALQRIATLPQMRRGLMRRAGTGASVLGILPGLG